MAGREEQRRERAAPPKGRCFSAVRAPRDSCSTMRDSCSTMRDSCSTMRDMPELRSSCWRADRGAQRLRNCREGHVAGEGRLLRRQGVQPLRHRH
jgi:hypothetical protein